MKICAIIAEFNPFHKGHENLIKKAKKETNCDYIFCFMSQNFTQRALPTICDKKTRAKMAVLAGADAVFEIPTALCVCNAEIFAKSMLKAIFCFKNITHLCFGSECGQIDQIVEVAKFLNHEPKCFQDAIKTFLNQGLSLNFSKEKALKFCIDKKYISFKNNKTAEQILTLPNNILGVEYIKFLLKQNSKIVPLTFCRDEKFSATKIRELFYQNKFSTIKQFMPETSFNLIKYSLETSAFPNLELFEKFKLLSLRQSDINNLKNIFDVSEGLENKIKKESINSKNYAEFLKNVISKRYTKNRIERIALSSLLKIDKQIITQTLKRKNLPYLKLLATKDKNVLKAIKASRTNIIIRKSDADNALKNKLAQKLNQIDNLANYVYSLLTNSLPNLNNLYVKTEFIKE